MTSPIRQTATEATSVTKSRVEEMDAVAVAIGPQQHPTSIQHQRTSFTTPVGGPLPNTPMDVDSRPGNTDARLRRASFGGVDGKGGPFFSSLTKQKRTNSSQFQATWDDQHPNRGPVEMLWRKYVSGRSNPNTSAFGG